MDEVWRWIQRATAVEKLMNSIQMRDFGQDVPKGAKCLGLKVAQVEESRYVPPVSLCYFLKCLSLSAEERMELQFDTDLSPSSSAFICFHPNTYYN